MSAAPRLRLAPESGVVARSDGGAFSSALARLLEAAEANVAIVFALEGDDLLPYATDGGGSFRIGADDRRAIARPLVSRRVERADGLGCLPAGATRALLVPLTCGDDAIGVAVLGYRDEPPDALGCAAEVELAGIAFANELVRAGGDADDRDLHELSRLASLGAFLVGVTHELRGPAGALALLVPEVVAALRGEVDPQEARALARDLERCSERVVDLATRLRGAGRRDGERRVVDLVEITQDAVGLARIHAPEIEFALVDGGAPVPVEGIRAELDQIAMNLLLNAIDACRAKGGPARVDVTVLADEDCATLTLSDSGAGIAPNLEERVFERFFTTKPRGAGTGVGLSVSREIAEAHGGELMLLPSSGGATFMMRLPLAARGTGRPSGGRDMQRATMAQSFETEGTRTQRIKVLLVDDDELVLRTHRRALSAFEVRGAASVADAKIALEAGDVDVVVSDLGMTDGGGVALHRWMLERLGDARPPMLFLTGGITSDKLQLAVDATGCRCLTKPAPMDALAAAIRHAIEKPRA